MTSSAATQIGYWRAQLADLPRDWQLPFARLRGHDRPPRWVDVAFDLPVESTTAERSARDRLLAAWLALLSRYTGQTDLAILTLLGGPSAFTDALPLRTDLSGNPSARELQRRVGRALDEALDHREILRVQPLAELTAGAPLPVAVAFDDDALPALSLLAALADAGAQLALTLTPRGEHLGARLWYNTTQFERADVERIAGHYQTLLTALAVRPDALLSALPLLTAAEATELLLTWNDTARPYPLDQCAHELFERYVREQPHALAAIHGDRRLSFAELSARANQCAHYLQARGVGPRMPVAICMEHSLELLIAILATLKAGGMYVPLDPTYPDARLALLLADCRAALLLTEQRLAPRLAALLPPPDAELNPAPQSNIQHPTSNIITLDADWPMIAREPATAPASSVTAEHPACVIYTSGSTGRPKGVLIPHRSLVNLACAAADEFALQPGDRFLQMASISFSAALEELFPALLSGGSVVFPRDRNALTAIPALLDLLALAQITAFEIITPHWHELVRALAAGAQLSASVRIVVMGGERALPELVAQWQRLDLPLIHVYGPTESTATATYYRCTGHAPPDDGHWLLPIGRPIANTQLYLLDANLQPVPVGVPGELYIGGDALAHGYLDRPALTAERFIPNPFGDVGCWMLDVGLRADSESIQHPTSPIQNGARLYKTGDLARWLPDGNLVFLGRVDHQVKVRGFRIEPGEIEATLEGHPAVAQAQALVAEDRPGDRRIVAYIVARAGQPPTVGELRAYLRQKLPAYMVPAAFMVLDALPLTPHGKVDRAALLATDHGTLELSQPFVAPRAGAETALAEIWAELLGRERIGAHDDFFELGGHSLLAARITARIRDVFGLDLLPGHLFDAPSVAGLAATIERLRAAALGANSDAPHQRFSRAALEELRAARARIVQELGQPPGVLDAGPVSVSQQGLWFLDQLTPGSPLYNVPWSWRLRGPLVVAALEHALAAVMARHTALRSRFELHADRPIQLVAPMERFTLPLIDLAALPAEEQESVARQHAADEALRPFDLRSGPLLRVQLLRLGPDEHILLVNVHHIVFDGWSLGIMLRELAVGYRAQLAGRSALADLEQAPLPLQYADFAVWQQQQLQGAALDQQLSYWRQQLGPQDSPAPTELALPTDRPRSANPGDAGATLSFELSAALHGALADLARRERATLFMVLLAAWDTLLYRYTGQRDLLVGTPVAGRTRPELEGLIGFFVNTLVLRARLTDHLSFRALLAQVRRTALEAYAHQDLPLDKLVEALQPGRSLSRHPLFQVMFAFEEDPTAQIDLPGLTVGPIEDIATGTAKFDLNVTVTRRGARLAVTLEYSTELFDAATITRLAGHWTTLLTAIAADPQQHLDELPLLTATEREQLLVAWNPPVADTPDDLSFDQLFAARAVRTPAALAAVCGDQSLTYAELDRRADRLAAHLRQLGVGGPDARGTLDETIIGICIEHSLDLVVGLLGILKAGGAYLPLDPSYPPERLAFMLTDTRAPIVLTAQHLVPLLADVLRDPRTPGGRGDCTIIALDAEWPAIESTPAMAVPPAIDPQRLAYVVYTSGSTGRPKGVLVEHRQLVAFARAAARQLALEPSDRFLQLASISFDVLAEELFPAWLSGAAVILPPDQVLRGGVDELLRVVEQARVTILELTTAYWNVLVRELTATGARLPATLSRVVMGGERTTPEAVVDWQRLGVPLVHVYGLTETTVTSTIYTLDPAARPPEPLPVGRPIGANRIYLLDHRMQPVPIGIPGELYISGPQVARGYHNRPALTAERFIPDNFGCWMLDFGLGAGSDSSQHPKSNIQNSSRLYKTGDLARWLPDGQIEILGRIDGQIKLRGFRIEPGEIAAALEAHPVVRQALVVARDVTPGDPRLIAYLALNAQRSATSDQGAEWAAELRGFLRERLPEYMIPSAFVALDSFPLTPNGKIDPARLPTPAPDRREPSHTFVAPRDPVEERLAEIWARLLGIGQVGVDDDFFALGGHSLLATQLLSRVRDAFGSAVGLRSFFEAPTVAAMARAIRGSQPESQRPIVPVAESAPSLDELLAEIERLSEQEARAALAGARQPQAAEVPDSVDRADLDRAWKDNA